MQIQITFANIKDAPVILEFIRALAKFENLETEMVATEENLKSTLFGEKPGAEVLFISEGTTKVGFALFFPSYSTFLAQPGIYLEDLFIQPAYRGKGYGKKLLSYLANLAVERGCGRLEWSVLNWNKPAITLYLNLGSKPMNEWTVHRLAGQSLVELAQSYSRNNETR